MYVDASETGPKYVMFQTHIRFVALYHCQLWINAISKCSGQINAGKEAEAVLEEMRSNGQEPNIIR